MEQFVKSLHPSTKLLSRGFATVQDRRVEAVQVRNIYNQVIVWGHFGCSRGKFKGFLANNANTEGVIYETSDSQ